MRVVVWLLCLTGFIVSVRMQRKSVLAQRGLVTEPSVVQTPRARLFAGIPNSAFGLAYYALIALAAFFFDVPIVRILALCAAVLAATTSLYLAYSLLFVTKMPCVNCWIGHVVNWALLFACATAM